MGNQVSSQGNEDHFGLNSNTNNNNPDNGGNNNNNLNSGDKKTNTKIRRGEMIIPTMDKSKESLGSGLFKDNVSSYKGVKTDCSVGSELSNVTGVSVEKEQESTNVTNEVSVQDELKDMKVPTLFEWKEGGVNVYLTGSFCNWNQKFLMNQLGNRFEICLDLPRSVYQYKFVVDGRWVFSKHHPTCNDGRGNINNIIDSTNFPVPVQYFHEKHTKTEKTSKISNFAQNGIKKQDSYNCIFPSKKDLHVDATTCPDNYKHTYSMLENAHLLRIGRPDYILSISEALMRNTHTNENTSYLPIPVSPHVNLNHLSVESKVKAKRKVLTTSSTHRIRNKFVTIVYYKPIS